MDKMTTAILAIVGGIISLAVISVLVSPKAQTPAVLGAAGSSLANVVTAAVSPVTGTGANTGSSSVGGGLGGLLSNFGGGFSPSTIGSLFGG